MCSRVCVCVVVVTVSGCVCVCVWAHFGKLLFQNMPTNAPCGAKFFFCLRTSTFSLVIVVIGFAGWVAWVVRSSGWLSVTVVSGSIRSPCVCLYVYVPPGVGIWRLVAAIECVKIIVNFSDTHRTSMGRLSATPCQGQRQRRGRGGCGLV